MKYELSNAKIEYHRIVFIVSKILYVCTEAIKYMPEKWFLVIMHNTCNTNVKKITIFITILSPKHYDINC